jgi:hypothetical protein
MKCNPASHFGNYSDDTACPPGEIPPAIPNSNSVTLFVRVKRWHYLVLAVGVVAGAVYLYWQSGAPGFSSLRRFWNNGTVADQASDSAGRPGWQVVDRPDDGFKVEMPGDPRDRQVPAYNEVGGAEPVHMLIAARGDDTTFAITWQDNPPILRSSDYSPDRTLNAARDGMLTRTRTSLISQSTSVQHGYPSLDVTARNAQGGVLHARLISSGNRLYMLMALSPSAGAVSDLDVSRFFDSFNPTESGSIPEKPTGLRKNPGRSTFQH